MHSWLNNDDRQKIEAGQPLAAAILQAARRSDEPMLVAGGSEYALGAASLPGGGVVVAGLPMPTGLNAIMSGPEHAGPASTGRCTGSGALSACTYFLLLLMLTALVFFASSWLALNVSRQMTGPLEALADATVEIGKGDYSHRVTAEATAEMSELVRAFNAMAADLEQSRLLRRDFSARAFRREPGGRGAAQGAGDHPRDHSFRRGDARCIAPDCARESCLCRAAAPRRPAGPGGSLAGRAAACGIQRGADAPGAPRAPHGHGFVGIRTAHAARIGEPFRHARCAGSAARAESRFDPRARGPVGVPARAAPGRLERGRAAGGARNQKPAHAHHAFRGAHSPPRRSRPAGIGRASFASAAT